MKKLIGKYVGKIINQGLAEPGSITFLCLDAEITSNRSLAEIDSGLLRVFDLININSLLYVEPAEPYKSILNYLSTHETDHLLPTDCETRTFLHDIPLITELSADAISIALSKRKAAIIGNRGIVTYGTVSPEQAFVSFSSVCFSIFVKFFTDVLFHLDDHAFGERAKNADLLAAYHKIAAKTALSFPPCDSIPSAPPRHENEVLRQIIATGKELVARRLVDSYFGNISYVFHDTIYISQTGSSLDELETCIDAVPLDGSSSAGITASSELSAHMGIYKKTGKRAIIHGHPTFTVIMSMSCRKEGCDLSTCYRSCKEKRSVSGVQVVSGEIGTGPTGLVSTVPEALEGDQSVIVFGHGIFSVSDNSFRQAFELVQTVEEACMREYFTKIHGLI